MKPAPVTQDFRDPARRLDNVSTTVVVRANGVNDSRAVLRYRRTEDSRILDTHNQALLPAAEVLHRKFVLRKALLEDDRGAVGRDAGAF
jgi:hypothetical protein